MARKRKRNETPDGIPETPASGEMEAEIKVGISQRERELHALIYFVRNAVLTEGLPSAQRVEAEQAAENFIKKLEKTLSATK